MGKLRRTRARAHPTRHRVLEFVNSFRGTNSTRLERALGLTRSNARHHLQVLEKSGMVKRVSLGRESHYFPADAEPAEVEILSRAQHGRAWKIMGVVLAEPGITQRDLGRRVGMSRKVLRPKLDTLVDAGMIEERLEGRLHRYLPGPRVGGTLRGLLGRMGPPPANVPPGSTGGVAPQKTSAVDEPANASRPDD